VDVISIHPVFGMESSAVSVQFGFPCIVIYSSLHRTPSICVPVYHSLCISGRRSEVPFLYGIVVRLWELGHVPPGAIYISCYQILERLLNSSIFVSSRFWTIVFVYAFQGIQPQLVCLLEGLRRVFLMGFVVFRVTSYGRVCRFGIIAV